MIWKKYSKGIRFKEHPTRRHGLGHDRYYTIYYRIRGKLVEEGVGWASEGWTASKVEELLREIKRNIKSGQGPQSLKEMREWRAREEAQRRSEEERKRRESVRFREFFEQDYLRQARLMKREKSLRTEIGYYNAWLKPVIGEKTFKEISKADLETIKAQVLGAGRTPRTLQYCLAIVRQVWNAAKKLDIVSTDSPTKGVSIPKIDNQRVRFLTHEEAKGLLEELGRRSQVTHDIAFISLNTGMRFSEITSLRWGSVRFDQNLIEVINAKSGSRVVPMNRAVKEILIQRYGQGCDPAELVFKDSRGNMIKAVSKTFQRVADWMFNQGVEDPKQRVVFHTLRHTFASWLVQSGEPLYNVQKLLGHRSFVMVERYSHLSPETLHKAVSKLELAAEEGPAGEGSRRPKLRVIRSKDKKPQ